MFASWVCVRVRVTNLCVCVKESVCVCDKVVWERVVCNEVVCVCVCERDVFASRVWQSYVELCVSKLCVCERLCVCATMLCVKELCAKERERRTDTRGRRTEEGSVQQKNKNSTQ